jgi:hypothetical protein
MLVLRSSNGDERFERALNGLRKDVDAKTLWQAACAPYRRVFGSVYRTGWFGPFGFILRPDTTDITPGELEQLKAEELLAVGRVDRVGGPIIVAFGNPRVGRECVERLYKISGRHEWRRGEEP